MAEPKCHELKTWSDFFNAVADGSKRFEIRRDDRDFAVGDVLVLREYDDGAYSGRSLRKRVNYVLRNAERVGLPSSFCILGIEEVSHG